MSFVEGASEIGEFNFVAKEMELDLDRYLNITLDWDSMSFISLSTFNLFLTDKFGGPFWTILTF